VTIGGCSDAPGPIEHFTIDRNGGQHFASDPSGLDGRIEIIAGVDAGPNTQGGVMYIGGGALVLILLIVVIVLLMRRGSR
jgi:hypothetical protein